MAEDIDHPLDDPADDVSGREVAGDGASSDVPGRPPVAPSLARARVEVMRSRASESMANS
ncbi:MAG: hypothetical protein GY911_13220 [Actinomycetales bacterium]|nr:hypothetical protein [Actinomycetales bacterium]